MSTPNDGAPARSAVLIEDNLLVSSSLVPALRREGFVVRTLPGGSGTVEAVAGTEPAPELVLVNLASSRFDGAALVRELRARPELAGTKLVGYAGHVERDRFEAGRAAGADAVVPNSALAQALPEVLAKLFR